MILSILSGQSAATRKYGHNTFQHAMRGTSGLTRPVCLFAALLTAGCATGPTDSPSSSASESPHVITDPEDFSNIGANGSHIHDYWEGNTNRELFSRDVTFTRLLNGQCSENSACSYEIKVPDGITVYPGTRWLNVSAAWSQEGQLSNVRVNFVYWHATKRGAPEFKQFAADGTATINTTEIMNDPPHTRVSHWEMSVNLQASGSGSVRLTISGEIGRPEGPLPLAPPHPDHWGTNETLIVARLGGRLQDFPGIGSPSEPSARPPSSPATIPFNAKQIIPPYTKQVIVRFAYNSSTPPMAHYDPVLSWHGSDRSVFERTAVEPTEEAIQSSNGLFVWKIDVSSRMWDSPYVNDTQWQIAVDWGGDVEFFDTATMDGDYDLRITAAREERKES